jgi:hypothetical protein
MATIEDSFFSNFRGRMGNFVFYPRKGKQIMRQIGISTKEPTEKQKKQRRGVGLSNKFVKGIRVFVNQGFELAAKGTNHTAFSLAQSVNSKRIIAGTYPDQTVDFSKALVTKGNLPLLRGAAVNVVEEGFEFVWDPHYETEAGEYWKDQVMLLVMHEDTFCSISTYAGAMRRNGRDLLHAVGLQAGNYHVYISILADDRKRISDSIYLGAVQWPG